MSVPNIGEKLFFSGGPPATFDKAGYEALSWTEVKGVVSIGATGYTVATIDIPDLATGITLAAKGAASGVDTTIVLREPRASDSDTGQPLVEAACAQGVNDVSFYVQLDGERLYLTGIAHSWQQNERSTTSYAGSQFTFRTNYPPLRAADPV